MHTHTYKYLYTTQRVSDRARDRDRMIWWGHWCGHWTDVRFCGMPYVVLWDCGSDGGGPVEGREQLCRYMLCSTYIYIYRLHILYIQLSTDLHTPHYAPQYSCPISSSLPTASSTEQPGIIVITPTYTRLTQRADMIRFSQTLRQVCTM